MLSKIELIALVEDAAGINAYFIENFAKILINYKIGRISNTTHLLRKLALGLVTRGGYTPILIEWHKSNLVLQKNNVISRIELKPEILLIMAQYNQIPIFIQNSVLFKEGIQINKKVIEDILQY